jgi:hypothetical protein
MTWQPGPNERWAGRSSRAILTDDGVFLDGYDATT